MVKRIKTKNAFTLAEVLITLVIIGVVAALTIPTAINKYKEQELKSQFKKAYSIIKQAIYKTEMYDFQGYAACYYGIGVSSNVTGCHSFFSHLANNLSLQKVCNNHSLSQGCIPVYQSYPTSEGCAGFGEYNLNNYYKTYVLADGQIFIPYGGGQMPLFLIDINGHKGPNASGKDVFLFHLKRDVTEFYLEGSADMSCFPVVSGGRTTAQMIQYALIKK